MCIRDSYKAGRCVDILINGKPINPNRDYKIALNSYLANGGDGYRVFLKAIDRFESSMFQRDVFIEYIKFLGGTIRPQVKNRIKVRYDDGVYFRFEQAA